MSQLNASSNLTEAQLAICKAFGVPPKDFAAANPSSLRTSFGTFTVDELSEGLSPAQLAMCRATGVSPAAFAAEGRSEGLPNRPAHAPIGGKPVAGPTERRPDAPGAHGLTETQIAICKACGVSPEDFARAKSRVRA